LTDMNELQFGNRIRQLLNEASGLPPGALARLRAARLAALERHRVEPVAVQARAGGALAGHGGLSWLPRALLVPAALLVLGLISLHSAQQKRAAAEIVELDVQLLSDELPIDAYLDKGFEAWLKKRRAR